MADNNRKQLIGKVLESKMKDTAIVRIDVKGPHPIYKKYVNKSKKYYVHDPENACIPGDLVSIIECQPKSKLKRWRFGKIEQKAIEE